MQKVIILEIYIAKYPAMWDDIIRYRDMCNAEDADNLQRGMNFRLNPNYSVVLMSRKSNAPYQDAILDDDETIEYEGHDERQTDGIKWKEVDQPQYTKNWSLTENGKFIQAIQQYKSWAAPEKVKIYEKIVPGVWSPRGLFDLVEYRIVFDGQRNVFKFILKLCPGQDIEKWTRADRPHSRNIPVGVRAAVYKRDGGKCVVCGSDKNLHFDHDLPFSKGGTSAMVENIQIMCMKCNLKKGNRVG